MSGRSLGTAQNKIQQCIMYMDLSNYIRVQGIKGYQIVKLWVSKHRDLLWVWKEAIGYILGLQIKSCKYWKQPEIYPNHPQLCHSYTKETIRGKELTQYEYYITGPVFCGRYSLRCCCKSPKTTQTSDSQIGVFWKFSNKICPDLIGSACFWDPKRGLECEVRFQRSTTSDWIT